MAAAEKQPEADAAANAAESPDTPDEAMEPSRDEAADAEAGAAELESQVANLTDRLLRAHAEMDNIRKRAEREKADASRYAISRFAGDIAVLGDNFQRAASAVPAGAAEQNPTLRSLLDGVMMMEREFLNVLERYGVRRIDPAGQPFNPHLHQAVMEQQNPEVPSGTVVQVFQPGYTIEDRVLRPAMVVVAKGGARQQPPEKPAEPAEEADQPHDAADGGNGAGATD
ncbi:MAG: nucleotide exchange factor GrpE [Hyphomicrobiaceae bacterium]|nr:nucleotide exchange factor GrpE [Hyphomicrobiaceae bacterium]